MAKITFILPDGAQRTVEAREGQSVMEAAVKQNVPGIDADCGGACSCATCQVYVDDAWRARTGEPSSGEHELLEFAENARPGSRLSCQIKVTAALGGLVVQIPDGQH